MTEKNKKICTIQKKAVTSDAACLARNSLTIPPKSRSRPAEYMQGVHFFAVHSYRRCKIKDSLRP